MKLSLIKKIENVENILTAVTIDAETAVFLSYREVDMKYQLLYIADNEYKVIVLDYTEKCYQLDNNPVLFAINGHFGIIKNQRELLLYSNEKQGFECIEIKGAEVLPQRFHLEWRIPISDSTVLPVCFRGDGLGTDTRYIAFLNVDIDHKQANWKSWMSLDSKSLPCHTDHSNPPKVDTVMLKNDELYTFTSGGKTTSVNKWGMDYYAFVKGDLNGKISQIIIDSGNLHLIDGKKRGVNGLLSTSHKYLMLTPVFQSDEWKGKPKIFSLELNELLEVTFPRGFGKYPQIIEHYGMYFWVYLRDKKELAICVGE